MFKILNTATEEEIAIITATINLLESKTTDQKKKSDNWYISSKKSISSYSWNNKSNSIWKLSTKDFS